MENLLYWVWFSRLFPYGSNKPKELLQIFADPKELYGMDPDQLRKTGVLSEKEISAVCHTSLDRAEQILTACSKKGIDILSFADPRYPIRLKNIYAPPAVIYVKGDLGEIDSELAITVVGTRNASEYGLSITGNLSFELARAGVVIISGCAMGIDEFAHKGALKAGGKTIGVLGCGLDIDYPKQNRDLKLAILKRGGVLMSEMPPGEFPTPKIFPIRNRLMAALSIGVLVTEAPVGSGALITAEHGIEQGKDLFCVPPRDIYSKRYSGVVKYLREGAIPVFAYWDILMEYVTRNSQWLESNPMLKGMWDKIVEKSLSQKSARSRSAQKTGIIKEKPEKLKNSSVRLPDWETEYSLQHKKVYELLNDTPQFIDNIVSESQLSMSQVLSLLTELEIVGLVVSHSGGRYTRAE